MSQWNSFDNLFNFQEFYDTVVGMFEKDPEHPWVVDSLGWWNEYDSFFISIHEVIKSL
jgi:hypothetical protein